MSIEQRMADAPASSIVFTSAMSQRKLNVGVDTPPATADDLNTAIVDTIPHWFAQAVKQEGRGPAGDFDYGGTGAQVQYILSLERALSDAWRQVLWEPWSVEEVKEGWRFQPPAHGGHELWRAWVWREQSNLLQRSFLFGHRDRAAPGPHPRFLAKTAVGAVHGAGYWRLVVGEPSDLQSDRHQTELVV